MSPSPSRNTPDATPPELRFLKRLVTTLAAVMIVGIAIIVALLFIRLSAPPATLDLPETIALPEGASAEAVTMTADAVIVVTGSEILFFDRATGRETRRYPLD
ncbi:MAG: Protein of unknown function (DUF2628) [Rhodobacteraceae bacterium HLUCCA12]|nr:MAG: Protein of unknown function (DUF2628) [Rhodobacteraceae bacterium HLUCCA12]